jgi:hypothetical protein
MNRTGTAVVMAVALTSAFGGCGYDRYRPPPNQETIASTPTAGHLEGHPVLGMPIEIPGTKAAIVPLTMQSQKGLFADDDPYTRGGMASYSSRSSVMTPATMSADAASVPPGRWIAWNAPAEVRWHNVIATAEGAKDELVLDKRGVIGRWQMFGAYDQTGQKFDVRGILFIAVVADTNGDKALDNLDARVAIVTTETGRHPHIISPPDAQVWSAAYSLERNVVYLEVVKDTNGDGKFQYDDDPVPYEWKVGSDGPAVPLLSEEAVRRALSYLK